MARDRANINTGILKDPEFTSLKRMAQWIYLSRRIYGQKELTTVELVQSWARDVEAEDAKNAIEELAATSYGYVLMKRVTRQKMSPALRQEVYESDGFACVICGTSENLEIDHIIPVSKGGTDDRINLQTMCAHHNRKKGNRINGLV